MNARAMALPLALVCCLLAAACDQASEETQEFRGVEGDGLAPPPNARPGDPVRGTDIFASREAGHCVLCHKLSSVDAPFQGDLGPALDGIGSRLSGQQIRLRIAAPHLVWPGTVMPSYGRTLGLHQVDPDHQGEPILSGQEIEDLVAFLSLQTGAEVQDG